MRIRKLVAPVGVAAVAIGMAAGTVIPASAANNIKPFGQPESLNDPATGAPMITYTVHGLNPSSDAVFHNGQLYEAAVTVDGGIPVVPLFNARAESGQNYRVIGGGAPGKLYFDVVGDTPNSVVYNDGVQDLLTWVSTGPMASGAPDVAGESTEIIGGAPAAGPEATGDDVAPAVVPAPEEVNPFETPEQHAAHGGG
ncbi:MAG TPA: DUF1942 domain-containing protein [Mycobacterium sp.]